VNGEPVDAGATESRDETFGRFGYDLNEAARRGDLEPVRCRDDEVARCIDILLRQTKHNPALIGAAGVGKTAIVEGLAQRIVAGDVPAALRGTRIVSLDHVALLAGTIYRGQFEARVRRLVRAIEDDPDVILFVDEMHNLIGQGSAVGVAMDAANMLKPALVRPDIRVIGATTQVEYDRWVKGDPALEQRFQPVVIRELTSEETLEILRARRPRLEHHHAVAIADEAVVAAQVLTDRFVTDRAQPDKAIDVLDEACAHAQAVAQLPAELERILRERRHLDAALRREAGRAGVPSYRRTEEADPLGTLAREVLPVLDRIGAEIERFFGGMNGSADAKTPRRQEGAQSPGARRQDAQGTANGRRRTDAPPSESLAQRRDRLDGELRRGLERLGIVVKGQDVARAVSVAVGKRIEWAG
jgi:ATP-dependent Clp protease ATP-binding subunit ClpA